MYFLKEKINASRDKVKRNNESGNVGKIFSRIQLDIEH
jgi:hypothetical protein